VCLICSAEQSVEDYNNLPDKIVRQHLQLTKRNEEINYSCNSLERAILEPGFIKSLLRVKRIRKLSYCCNYALGRICKSKMPERIPYLHYFILIDPVRKDIVKMMRSPGHSG
jgi:hypothetical protein